MQWRIFASTSLVLHILYAQLLPVQPLCTLELLRYQNGMFTNKKWKMYIRRCIY